MFRTGLGYDVHQLVPGRKCVLGGVEIPHEKGLDGHSDADVLIHAISDALLGSMGEVDIGHYFPNTDPRWKNVSSLVFLEEIRQVMLRKHSTLCNIDATVIAEAPKIFPHIPEMKRRIATALGVEESQIGIKATTNEAMGFVGRREGIAALAVAMMEIK